jgi:hypothetical protein
VLGDCLLELKTEKSPKMSACLRQLLGYVLLDFYDAMHIRRVGVYYARQPCLLTFDLEDLIGDVISRKGGIIAREIGERSGVSLEENLASLRTGFRRVARCR